MSCLGSSPKHGWFTRPTRPVDVLIVEEAGRIADIDGFFEVMDNNPSVRVIAGSVPDNFTESELDGQFTTIRWDDK